MYERNPVAGVIGAVLFVGLFAGAPGADAQESNDAADAPLFEKRPPPSERRRPPSPEALRRRIEELQERDPSDPRIPRLREMLSHLESLPEDDGPPPFGRGRARGPEFDEDAARAFLGQHPELDAVMAGGPRRHGRRRRAALMEIMRAYDAGNEALGELMIQSALLQHRIRPKLRAHRHATENGDAEGAAMLRLELEGLVRELVHVEHNIKGIELELLQERLIKQTRRHAERATHLDRAAERRLEALLEGRWRSGRGKGSGRRRGHSETRGGQQREDERPGG